MTDITTRTLTMKISFPSHMREEGIRRYIISQLHSDEWSESFKTNYIRVDGITVKLSKEDLL